MSRKRKPKKVEEGLLQRGWNALIQLKGLELPELPQGKRQLTQMSASTQSLVDSAIQHCGEQESVFRLQNPNPVSNIDYRAVGECVGRHVAEQLAAVESGNPGEHRTSNPLRAGRAGFEQGLKNLPQRLSPFLSRLLMQLQTIMSSETSSNARETLQMQLRRLISALSSRHSRLKTELSLQQQLIDSIERLERKLDNTYNSTRTITTNKIIYQYKIIHQFP